MRVHYERNPRVGDEKLLAELVMPMTFYGKNRPPDWEVIWSKALQPGESFDVGPLPPPPYENMYVQFKTTDGSTFAAPGTMILKTRVPKTSDVVTAQANGEIVVSDK